MALDNGLRELVCAQDINCEARLVQTSREVISIHANMIFLRKTPRTFCFALHGRIFVGRSRRIFLGNGQKGFAAGAKDSVKLAHGGAVVGHMLQNIAGNDDVEGALRNRRHGAHVEAEAAIGAVQIGGDVAPGCAFDTLPQPLFRCEVKDFFTRKKGGLVPTGPRSVTIEESGKHAVPHQAMAGRTTCALVPQVVGEAPAAPSADIALHSIAAQRGGKFALSALPFPARTGLAERGSPSCGQEIFHYAKWPVPRRSVNSNLAVSYRRPMRTDVIFGLKRRPPLSAR